MAPSRKRNAMGEVSQNSTLRPKAARHTSTMSSGRLMNGETVEQTIEVYDVVVVGAGPAGLMLA